MIANRVFNNTVRLFFGIPHKDVTNAFKAYRKEVLEAVDIDSIEAKGFDLTVEIPLKAHILGFSSVEVPVSWHDRKLGEAKLKLSENGHRYGLRLLKLFFWGASIGLKDLFEAVVKGSPIRLIFATLFGLLLILGIFSFADFSKVIGILSNVSLEFVGLATIMIFITFLFRTWRWGILLKVSGHKVRNSTAFKCIMFGWLLNYLLPARIGDVARGMALKSTEKIPLSISLSTIVLERAMDMLTLSLLLTIAIIFFTTNSSLFIVAISALLISILLVFGLILLSKYGYKIFTKFGKRFESIKNGIEGLNKGLHKIYTNPKSILICLILSILVWFFEILSLYFSAKAINFDLTFAIAAIAGITSFIAQAIPTTPGGIGIHEASIAGVLTLFDVDLNLGISIALIDHFVRGFVIFIFGAISTIHIGFESREYFVKRKKKLIKGK